LEVLKRVLYIDMDNVLVDFQTGIGRLEPEVRQEYEGRLDEAPGVFSLMDPVDDAVEAFKTLSRAFDTCVLSTSPWENPSAWSDKLGEGHPAAHLFAA
jgi:5'-nucleotidase